MPFLHLGETHFSPDFPLKKGCGGVVPVLDLLFRSLQEEKRIREENSSWYRHYLLPVAGRPSPWPTDTPTSGIPSS